MEGELKKSEIVELLNKDIEGEHAAIIQYLVHAYALGEGEMACEIEAIAREEMRHLDWLAEAVTKLDGIPSFTRGEMRTLGKTVTSWMKNDVRAEEDALKMYQEHIKAINLPHIRLLLERILSDERSHLGDFQSFADKAGKDGLEDMRGERQDKTTKMLNWGIEHEYTVVLQYLLHSYLAPVKEMKKEMQDQAINEMQHLGWLAEKMVSQGGHPKIEHGKIDRSAKAFDMLNADIKIEKQVAAVYDRAATEIDDPKLKRLLTRIRDHELYHVKVFSDLKKTVKE
jgi:bacterioferritin